jgi:hypothetical protein
MATTKAVARRQPARSEDEPEPQRADQPEDFNTVSVKAAKPNFAGLWDRSPAYRDVEGAVKIGDGDEETFEVFIRNEVTEVPRTSEVERALHDGRLVEAGKEAPKE